MWESIRQRNDQNDQARMQSHLTAIDPAIVYKIGTNQATHKSEKFNGRVQREAPP